MRPLLIAFAFLTRLPIDTGELSPAEIARASRWFPLVGGAIGAAIATVYAAGSALGLPPLAAAGLALALGLKGTGAMHEDALGDVADGFGGGWTPERRLEIMKDPRLGTYGVLAMTSALGLGAACIGALSGAQAMLILPAAHALSRVGMVWMLATQPQARPDGLGASAGRALTAADAGWALAVGLAIAAPLLQIWTIPAAGLCALATWDMTRRARRAIGGITGDVAGAAQQVALIALLLGATLI